MQHASVFASMLDHYVCPGSKVVDLGSGSGLLGFIGAFMYPEVHFTLLDSRQSCCDFIQNGVRDLGIGATVTVLKSRAEAMGRSSQHRHQYDGVIARRFGPPGATAECSAPILRQGGFVLVSDPSPQALDKEKLGTERWPDNGLRSLGLALEANLIKRGGKPDATDSQHHAALLRVVRLCGTEFPRSRRLKKPIF
jgi:16S rRNA G527 N7-methylase RsmG